MLALFVLLLLVLLLVDATGGHADGTRIVGDDDGLGDVCFDDLITVRLSVDVVAILDTPDEDDNGGLQDDVGGQ